MRGFSQAQSKIRLLGQNSKICLSKDTLAYLEVLQSEFHDTPTSKSKDDKQTDKQKDRLAMRFIYWVFFFYDRKLMSFHFHTNGDIDMGSFLLFSLHRAILFYMRYTSDEWLLRYGHSCQDVMIM